MSQNSKKAQSNPKIQTDTTTSAQSDVSSTEQSIQIQDLAELAIIEHKESSIEAQQNAQPIHVYDTIVVGAGISGIAAAIKLKKANYDNYLVIEKADKVGGTWRDNTYPGCGCDVPSALYSFSFAPSSKWSHLFAKQPEILNYLEDVATEFDIRDKIEFNLELLNAKWNEQQAYWQLQTSKGEYLAKTVVFSTGPITEATIPNIKGLDSFTGEMFHSARWKHDVDLTDKRIAVIGTGASAIQFVPQIQPFAKQLLVFQRTAPWVMPKPDFLLGDSAKRLIEKYPVIQKRWRGAVAGSLNVINFGLRHPSLLEPVSYLSRKLLKRQVKDQTLLRAVTPNFTIGCKRLLFANNYYPALQQPNTELIPHGLVEIQGNTVIAANGERHEVDVIIWGTGFDVAHPPIGKQVSNAQGQVLADLWKDSSPEAYLGASIQGVPNAFLVLGPNILVYDSFIGIAEAQLDYIVDGLVKMNNLGLKRFEIKKQVIDYHNIRVQKHLENTVFNSGGCKSYYLDQNGRNFAAWPWSLAELKDKLKNFDLTQYEIVK